MHMHIIFKSALSLSEQTCAACPVATTLVTDVSRLWLLTMSFHPSDRLRLCAVRRVGRAVAVAVPPILSFHNWYIHIIWESGTFFDATARAHARIILGRVRAQTWWVLAAAFLLPVALLWCALWLADMHRQSWRDFHLCRRRRHYLRAVPVFLCIVEVAKASPRQKGRPTPEHCLYRKYLIIYTHSALYTITKRQHKCIYSVFCRRHASNYAGRIHMHKYRVRKCIVMCSR